MDSDTPPPTLDVEAIAAEIAVLGSKMWPLWLHDDARHVIELSEQVLNALRASREEIARLRESARAEGTLPSDISGAVK